MHVKSSFEYEQTQKITYHLHAVQIVDVAMLKPVVMKAIFRRRNFWFIENGRLIHIVPGIDIQ